MTKDNPIQFRMDDETLKMLDRLKAKLKQASRAAVVRLAIVQLARAELTLPDRSKPVKRGRGK